MHTTRFAIDDAVTLKAESAAVLAVLRGDFDAEIARVTALRDELAKLQTTKQNYEDAQAKLAAAAAAEAGAKALLDAAKEEAKAIVANATQTLAAVNAQRIALDSASAKLASDRSAFDASAASAKQVFSQQSAALDVRESQVSAGEVALAAAQGKLNTERLAFNKRLEALKA